MNNLVISLVTYACLSLVAFPASAAITVSVAPDTQIVNVGNTVDVFLRVAGLEGGTALSAFGLDVGFDNTVLSYTGTQFGDPVLGDLLNLGGVGAITQDTLGLGILTLQEISLDDPSQLLARQASGFILAQVLFTAIGQGSSPKRWHPVGNHLVAASTTPPTTRPAGTAMPIPPPPAAKPSPTTALY